MMEYIQLNAAEFSFAWERLQPLLQRVVDTTDGELSATDIKIRVQLGIMLGFVAYEEDRIWGLAVAEVIEYPQFRALRVVAVAGEDFAAWKQFEANLEKLAAAMGCQYVEGLVRPGMVKLCADLGYRPKYTLIRKTVLKGYH